MKESFILSVLDNAANQTKTILNERVKNGFIIVFLIGMIVSFIGAYYYAFLKNLDMVIRAILFFMTNGIGFIFTFEFKKMSETDSTLFSSK